MTTPFAHDSSETPYDVAALTGRQQAVLALWPEFQVAAAMRWMSLDQVVRAIFHDRTGLADLPDEEAVQLEALLKTAITRLHMVAPARRQPPLSRSCGRGSA